MKTYTIIFTSDEIREISNALLSKRLSHIVRADKSESPLTKAGLNAMAKNIAKLELKILDSTNN